MNKDSSSAPGLLLRDYSSFLGESPMFQASGLYGTSLPRFSNLELVSYFLSNIPNISSVILCDFYLHCIVLYCCAL